MKSYNVLLLCGGDGSEHEISLVSASYIAKQFESMPDCSVFKVIIHKNSWVTESDEKCFLTYDHNLVVGGNEHHIDYVIPCIHGVPGETGDVQSLLEIIGIPYFGCNSESSKLCFNKISTKLWLSAGSIPNTPYIFIDSENSINIARAHEFFRENSKVFVKASSQGSSVGCYKVVKEEELDKYIHEAFKYSNSVLIEQAVKPRELEVAAYEYHGELVVTNPGEIVTPDNDFYSFEEKYNSSSKSVTYVEADVSDEIKEKIRQYARQAFKLLKLKDLSRIDFFLIGENEILLNEINTFPGMTPISMFPKMLEHHGDNMVDFIHSCIERAVVKE